MKHKLIAVIGLGYVGLPLAVAFADKFKVIGYDKSKIRVDQLKCQIDCTGELSKEELDNVRNNIRYTSNSDDLAEADVYIIAVPTPINISKTPDFDPLISATKDVAKYISRGDYVIYESTVYPGATEELCVPLIESISGLKYKSDFYCGYSPERINPGDKTHRLKDIVKVTSGCSEESSNFVASLYSEIIDAGVHRAESIKVAEAAKVIENTQRDLNIALVNELSKIFDLLDIDTGMVLNAAKTKWNFLDFRPGLVGGHCIGVDPYYLTHKASELNYHPEVILSGRRINDSMGQYVAHSVVKLMAKSKIEIVGSKILILGFTFKENCSDIRNTKVIDIVDCLRSYGADVELYDPVADPVEIFKSYGESPLKIPKTNYYDAVVLAVAHHAFIEDRERILHSYKKSGGVLYDVKHIFEIGEVDKRL